MIIVPGTDYLSTQYNDLDLSTGGLSEPITPSAFEFPELGVVEFEGKPAGPGNTDTIRKRLEHVHLPYPGARHSIAIEWTLVSIGSKSPVQIGGKKFDVMVTLTPGKRSLGRMEVIRSEDPMAQGGIFYSSVLVLFTATFANVDDPKDKMEVEDHVVMSTNQPGRWGVQPHRADVRIFSDKDVGTDLANRHEGLRPQMFDFFQLGGVFEGQPMRGGMVSNSI